MAGAGDLCQAYALAGWSGPVVLAAAAIAATFALLTKFVSRRLSDSTTLVFVAAALALTVPHLLARPHVLALPVMVAWVGGLIAAADRRAAPSLWLLPLMALWANLHGGFVFGLLLVGADRARCGDGRGRGVRANRCCCAGSPSASPRWRQAASRPMAGMRCSPRKRFSRSAARCR